MHLLVGSHCPAKKPTNGPDSVWIIQGVEELRHWWKQRRVALGGKRQLYSLFTMVIRPPSTHLAPNFRVYVPTDTGSQFLDKLNPSMLCKISQWVRSNFARRQGCLWAFGSCSGPRIFFSFRDPPQPMNYVININFFPWTVAGEVALVFLMFWFSRKSLALPDVFHLSLKEMILASTGQLKQLSRMCTWKIPGVVNWIRKVSQSSWVRIPLKTPKISRCTYEPIA